MTGQPSIWDRGFLGLLEKTKIKFDTPSIVCHQTLVRWIGQLNPKIPNDHFCSVGYAALESIPFNLTSVRGGIVAEVDCPIVVVVIEAVGGISSSGVPPPMLETVCMPQVRSPVQQ